MTRIGHASPRAALRYQHVIDGQDADIVRYLERFADTPPVPTHHRNAPQVVGSLWARDNGGPMRPTDRTAPEQDVCSGDDGIRTHDPLLAKQNGGCPRGYAQWWCCLLYTSPSPRD